LNLKYHHFREEVKKGTISIYHVSTKDHWHNGTAQGCLPQGCGLVSLHRAWWTP
jgi:hypothetical protein